MKPLALSIPATGEALGGMSRATVYRRIKDEQLKLVRIGGRSMVTMSSIEALLGVAA